MANTAITKTLAKEIQKDINRLLGRGRTAFKCPLNGEEMENFWHNMLPPLAVEAYKILEADKFDTASMTHHEVRFAVRIESGNFAVRFIELGQSFLRRNRYDSKYKRCDQGDVSRAMGAEKWEPFKFWMENTAIIVRDFSPAITTLSSVLEFCGTIGQLTRAIPDLYKYLPREKQEILRDQTRASNMPHEWHVFDRTLIDNLTFCMAKASLLPKGDGVEFNDIKATEAQFFEETA